MIKIETYLEDYLYNDIMEAFYMDNIEQFKYGYKASNFYAWDCCYRGFKRVLKATDSSKPNIERLCFSLIKYLREWGMYSRNATAVVNHFTCSKYRNIVIDIITNYGDLADMSLEEWVGSKDKKERVKKLYDNIKIDKNKQIKISNTLKSKILLATLGCMPAYDNNVKTAFCEMFSAENSISIIEKVSRLAGIFKDINLINYPIIKILKDMGHPDMKIMDFCLFFYGKHLNDLKNK